MISLDKWEAELIIHYFLNWYLELMINNYYCTWMLYNNNCNPSIIMLDCRVVVEDQDPQDQLDLVAKG